MSYALGNLRRRRTRSALTIAGVTLAITLLVILLSLSQGLKGSVDDILEETGVDIFVFGVGWDPLFGPQTDFVNGREMAARMEQGPGIRATVAMLIAEVYAINASDAARIRLGENARAVDFASIQGNGFVPEKASQAQFGGVDFLHGGRMHIGEDPHWANGSYAGPWTGELVLSIGAATDLRVGVNDTIYLGGRLPVGAFDAWEWLNRSQPFAIRGITQATFDQPTANTAFLHLSELQDLTGRKNDTINEILVDLYNPAEADAAKAWIEANFQDPPVVAVTQANFLSSVNEFARIFEGLGAVVVLVTVLVATMFTATILVLSIRERSREIGVMRAIGLSRRTIFSMVLVEALAISVIGLGLGLAFGYVGALELNSFLKGYTDSFPSGFEFTRFSASLIGYAAGLALALGVGSGIIPAAKASATNIVSVLRSE